MFSFRFWWLCNSKHTEGVPMAQLFATGIYTTIWTLPWSSRSSDAVAAAASPKTVPYSLGFLLLVTIMLFFS